ncbi:MULTISPECIES: curli assembly protein CsgF [Vibrio]|uniref:Curli production assembly/transport component CsgF n=1 Tax=Vibrio barjaei TaxID=1676683 RepID=A0ABW7IRC7_9VIBR|nr:MULTISPECIES: curli assembly protein CsgF [Vibrio]MCF4172917.1 curli production assembly protein CsgF [Vibrio sp. McD22-P3]MCG9663641.1 curli production assembly protein CsgF [Vibrio mediterranei]MCG9789118.1 curli production assembly protein CsgF [Vibrio mediterranei]MCY9853446.1 curli production assembly protein CsgF [Vibrio mediterranei]MCY9873976.1 curli production assembly protein CsgF [Vibrio barjaei]
MANLSTKLALIGILGSPLTLASELVYTPVNPTFGGNPLNSTILINHANAINDYQDPNASSFDFEEESALDRLASSLESRLISQLLADIGNGNTGQLETDDFFLNVVDDSGTLLVQIVDKATGESTEISVSGLNPDL